jgi:hypothetical protein
MVISDRVYLQQYSFGGDHLMKEIFISHRSTDKAFADLFVDFLLRCGLQSDSIFCSSLPGNDIKADIPSEIKDTLKNSILNVVLLSAEYYKSPYCTNEEGIIWFLDTPKIIICLPEIDERLLEGFLNSDNKIRRLDNKDDLLAIADIIRPHFNQLFVNSAAKLNANIDKLIGEYQFSLETRVVSVSNENPPKSNELEDMIMADNFIAEELASLRFLHDTQTDVFKQSSELFLEWLENHKISFNSSIEIAQFLIDAGIANIYYSDDEGIHSVKLTANTYRALMKLSRKALEYIDTSLYENSIKNSAVTCVESVGNNIDKLIINGFSNEEMLFVQYIIESGRIKFMCGWQLEQELQKIRAWEEINNINESLSEAYTTVLDRFEIRKFIQASQFTSGGYVKEYELTEDSFNWIGSLTEASIEKLSSVKERYQNMMIIADDDELPF